MMPRFTIIAAAALCLACLSAFAVPAAASEARDVLENTVNRVLTELKKPAMRDPATRPPVLANIEKIIRQLFSFDELSMRSVGPKWQSFTPEQKTQFGTAFEDLLRARYLNSMGGYDGEKIAYTGETASTKGDKVEIQTVVESAGKSVPVAYRMLKTDRWLVYDVIIEGVSLVQNYRAQFQATLDRNKGDVDALIRSIRQTTDELAAAKTPVN
ncbi:MAG: ABC transporter substrate-binding protein [Desulfovibrio sp.]|jgi:phospholipid transport system substrate-binding protein|nr:ABC transporter substrate-binding protein [Desulfovibrio sp.]